MLTIGEFARLGNVSVRMLRHYDALGVLVPARVDPSSGYRSYSGDQLARLDRLLALKDLGFTLETVRSILDDEVTADELRGMLRMRRAELAAQITADTERLARVEARLRSIESEDVVSDLEFVVRPVQGHRLAALSERVDEGVEAVGPVVGPLMGRLMGCVVAAGAAPQGPAVAWYEVDADGPVTVHAGLPVGGAAVPGTQDVELAGAGEAVVVVHRGPMAGIGETWQQLMRWISAQGLTPGDPGREVYLHTPDGDQSDWVTEIQQPVRS